MRLIVTLPMRLSPLVAILLLLAAHGIAAAEGETQPGWWARTSDRLTKGINEIMAQPHTDVVLSGYAYHVRSTYDKDRIHELTEWLWGGGVAKTLYDQDDDSHSLFVLASIDSRDRFQGMAGYAFQKRFRLVSDLKAGIGYSAFLVSRADLVGYVPVPGVLPLASIGTRKVQAVVIYIPRFSQSHKGVGNVIWTLAKFEL
jgi:palmitoyl transferase